MLKLATILYLLANQTGSAGGTLASGRTVTTHSDAWSVTSEFTEDTATIDTGGYRIIVAPMDITVDGMVQCAIKESSKDVVVQVKGDRITFTVDGQQVAERVEASGKVVEEGDVLPRQ